MFHSNGGRLRSRSDYEPEPGNRWTTWGTVSSGFREIEMGWNRLESVGLLAPAILRRRLKSCACFRLRRVYLGDGLITHRPGDCPSENLANGWGHGIADLADG